SWVVRAPFKMPPATHQMTVGAGYQVRMSDGRFYEGNFTGYSYKKETLDSPLCRVYLELDIALGHIGLDEIEVAGLLKTAAPPMSPSNEADLQRAIALKNAGKRSKK